MSSPITDVVILGGGSAGWMTASYLAKGLHRSVRVTLIEAATIPKIGVGEATIPNLQRVFFDYLDLPEEEWMRGCNASIKMGLKFVNWRAPRTDGVDNHFYHTFGVQPLCDGVPISHFWVKRYHEGDRRPYAEVCLTESAMLDAKRAPRWLNGRRATNYAWHFDANLVAEYLKNYSVKSYGVRHIIDEYEEAIVDERGFIEGLRLKSGAVIAGDLFVDCSGFRGLLINKAMGEPFVAMNDYLLCDSAVAAAIPHDDATFGIEPYTSAIAMDSGWTWKIPMLGRFGSGYVFSSQHATMDRAAEDFCRLWGIDENRVPLNKIRFRVGRNRRAWVKNVVGIGLSSCFLEPLESTGLYFIYAAAYQLMKHFPDRDFNPKLIDCFNKEIDTMFDDCRDFIQAHYVVSPREDTPFWSANKHDLVLSDNFTDKLETYKAGLAVNMLNMSSSDYYSNFELEFRTFWTNHNYYCIFSGLGCIPEREWPALAHKPAAREKADRTFAEITQTQRDLVETLPSLYTYLRTLHRKADARFEEPMAQTGVLAGAPPAIIG